MSAETHAGGMLNTATVCWKMCRCYTNTACLLKHMQVVC